VAAPGVLGNDSDADGTPLTAILVSGPAHGTLTLNPDGSYHYEPAPNYSGADGFTYKANDGSADSAEATVAIVVGDVSDTPVAEPDTFATSEDTALNIPAPGVLANDANPDGGALTAVLITGTTHGTLALNADGSFSYTPAANYYGNDSFTYQASGGGATSNLVTVSLSVASVPDTPVASPNSYTKNEDAVLTVAAPGLLGNDKDGDGDPLSAVLVSGPSHGTLSLNPDGSFVYTPVPNYNGPDGFTYRASDGTLQSADAAVTITVKSVNDAPVAVGESYSVDEDGLLTIGAPGVLANDTDVDSPVLTTVRVSSPAHGTLTLNADGSFTYRPAANYRGPDSFTYRARDGSTNSNVATVSLTVVSVNDAPVAASQAKSLNEDATRAITLAATDADGDALTYSIVTPPAHGVLTGTAPNVTYVPQANYNGPDSFTFVARDASLTSNVATVSLTVTPVNDAPVAQAAAYSTPRNTRFSRQLVASDVDGNPLTYTVTTLPTKGTVVVNPATGAFTYTPGAGKTGADSFRFRVNDGTTNSNIAVISISIQ
jgi:VCBS repeat-containing protein